MTRKMMLKTACLSSSPGGRNLTELERKAAIPLAFRGGRRLPCSLFLTALGPHFSSFWLPSWPPTCTKNRPKSVPRAIQKPSQWAIRFRSVWKAIFNAFSYQVGTPKPFKIELSLERRAYFAYFACLLAGRLLGTIWEPTWPHFG